MPPTRLSASRPTFRRFGLAALPPEEAVARPVGLLRALRPGDAPIASWSMAATPALVLGRGAGAPPVDRDAAHAAGVSVVRRTSGGGPVLWDGGLVALDVILPPHHPLAPADVVETYRWLGEAVAAALCALGLPGVEVVDIARARRTPPGVAATACFGGISPFEVLVEGRKVLGLSQARRRPGTLLQAGILTRVDGELAARLMAEDGAFGAALSNHAAGLGEWLADVGADDVVEAVDRALAAAGIALCDSEPTRAEQDAIGAVIAEGRAAE